MASALDNGMGDLIVLDFKAKRVLEIQRVSHFESIKHKLENRFPIIPKEVRDAWSLGAVHDEPYGFGCSHGIKWTSKARKQSPIWNEPIPFPLEINLNTAHIGKMVRYGGTDPLMWMDHKYRITYEFIKAKRGSALLIETRSDLIAHDDYIEVLDKNNHEIIIWTNNLSAESLRRVEPGAPSNKRRLLAASKLKTLGYKVTVKKQLIKLKRKVA